MAVDAETALGSETAAEAPPSGPPDAGSPDSGAGSGIAAEPSYQGTQIPSAAGEGPITGLDPELDRLVNGLLPHLNGPITSDVVVDKLRNDLRAFAGRYNASRERIQAYEQDLKGRAESYRELASTPGMKELMLGWSSQNPEMFQQGIRILADQMGLPYNGAAPAAPGAPPGMGGQNVSGGISADTPWNQVPVEKFPQYLDARIQGQLEQRIGQLLDAKMKQHVGPLYDTLGRYQREQQFAKLTSRLPDFEKFQPQVEALLRSGRAQTEEDAYVIAKYMANGFRQPTANPAGAVSEGAGQPSPLEETDPDEAIRQMIFAAKNRNRRP